MLGAFRATSTAYLNTVFKRRVTLRPFLQAVKIMPFPTRPSTFADFIRLHHCLACDCPKCGRSVGLNLAALIMRGKGDRHVHAAGVPLLRLCRTYRIIRPDTSPALSAPALGSPMRPEGRGGIWETRSRRTGGA